MAEVNYETLAAPQPDGSWNGVWSQNFTLSNGEYAIAGVTVSELAKTFDTPSFILDVADMRARAQAWSVAMTNAFAGLGGAEVYYAGKAFLSKFLAKEMYAAGLHLDTASAGELQVALAAGVPGSACGLHGNNKSEAEIELALDAGIAHIVIDSISEISLVNEIAQRKGVSAPVYLRLTTGVHAGGHEFIATAHEDQKFGLSISTGLAQAAILQVSAAPALELRGLHSHIGSQIMATAGFVEAARIILAQRAWAASQGIMIPEIDLGGGYGVRYTAADAVPPKPEVFAQALAEVVAVHCAETGLPAPLVSIEPGRSIIAPAMFTLYRVGTVKSVAVDDGQRLYVSVDGGMSDNIRPALYGANYTAALVSRSSKAPLVRARIVGKHCESGDIVVHNLALPEDMQRGDLVAVPVTGAYGYAMSSNYNLLTKPNVVAVESGQAREILRRQTVTDLLAYDMD
ncbi:MAG: diaminopimelate decarboxylase [Arcanobacterium sp.]|nr:diaminopimelate decarboxylase [Arcanobacterium sp.]